MEKVCRDYKVDTFFEKSVFEKGYPKHESKNLGLIHNLKYPGSKWIFSNFPNL